MRISQSSIKAETMDSSVQSKWGWFIALGVALTAMGVFAFGNLVTATTISILYVGALMTIGGVFQIAHAFQVKRWSGFFFFIFSGLLYAVAGVVAFLNPLLAAATLTFFLAIVLVASGAVRIWSGLSLRPELGWGWALVSGLTTLLVGSVFILGWPVNTLWLLGMILAVDLTFQGLAAIALGVTLKSLNRLPTSFSGSTASVH